MVSMIHGETYLHANAATSSLPFALRGGDYTVTVVATFGGGSVKLQKLAGDGTTYVSCSSTTDFTAAGGASVSLAPGDYRFTIATASAVYAQITAIPLRAAD